MSDTGFGDIDPLDDLQREPSRTTSRVSSRPYTPPQPYEKFHLDENEIPQGMDAFWLPTKTLGQPMNREVGHYYKAGWRPAKAADVPRVSGYGTDYPQELIDAKLIDVVGAESPVIIDDLMLVFRPKEQSAKAHARREQDANSQVRNQFKRLQMAYRHQGGDLGIERRVGAPPRAVMSAQPDIDEE